MIKCWRDVDRAKKIFPRAVTPHSHRRRNNVRSKVVAGEGGGGSRADR